MQVNVNHDEIERFKRSWPCNGIPKLHSIIFHFDSRGDLVDIEAFDEDTLYIDSASFDGAALVALSQDAQERKLGTVVA